MKNNSYDNFLAYYFYPFVPKGIKLSMKVCLIAYVSPLIKLENHIACPLGQPIQQTPSPDPCSLIIDFPQIQLRFTLWTFSTFILLQKIHFLYKNMFLCVLSYKFLKIILNIYIKSINMIMEKYITNIVLKVDFK